MPKPASSQNHSMQAPRDVLYNGEFTTTIAATDRGLAYGDGTFTTIAVRTGQACLWDLHQQRLLTACQHLHLPQPDWPQLLVEAEQLAQGRTGVLKIILTRGSGGQGYQLPHKTSLTRLLLWRDWSACPHAYYQQGISLMRCQQRLAAQPILAGIKHLNRLEQVLAAAELKPPYAEGVLLDQQEHVIEAIACNIFMLKQGQLITPDLSVCGVAGVMRQHIIDTAQQLGISTAIRTISWSELLNAEEIFLCNSVIGLWPVKVLTDKIVLPSTVFAHKMLAAIQTVCLAGTILE